MKQPRLFNRLLRETTGRCLMLLLFALISLSAQAKEAYAVQTRTNAGQKLTFYYDDLKDSRTGYEHIFSLNTGKDTPEWVQYDIEQYIFDASFAEARPTSTHAWFYGDLNMNQYSIIGIKNLNTSEVTDMSDMFFDCKSITSLDLSGFDTHNVTDMRAMFYYCNRLYDIDLSSFDTRNVTDMDLMFYNCNSLRTIYAGGGWNTENVTGSTSLFVNCTALVGGAGSMNNYGFDYTYARIDGGEENPGYLTFKGVYAKILDDGKTLSFKKGVYSGKWTATMYDLKYANYYPNWYDEGNYVNVINVVFDPSFSVVYPTTTYSWFNGMSNLNTITGIEYLNTSEVTNMGFMFNNCSSLRSLDLHNFNTQQVTDMACMFKGCIKLKSIVVDESWTTENVTYSDNMFLDCVGIVGSQGTTYDANHVDKTYAHIDGGPSNPGYLADPNEAVEPDVQIDPDAPYAVLSEDGKTLQFRHDGQRQNITTLKTYRLNTGRHTPGWVDDGSNAEITSVVFLEEFANARPESMHGWFEGMSNLTRIWYMDRLNTSEVTNMEDLFKGCSKLTSDKFDISGFNTSQVTDMRGMFEGCIVVSGLDLSHFDTGNVTNMAHMFSGCTRLTSLNIEGLNTTKVSNMSDMFNGCPMTHLDVSSFDTRQVTDMSGMFRNCKARVDLTGFETPNVRDMHEMFKQSSVEVLDLRGFNTVQVTNMSGMFEKCLYLSTITVGDDWTVANVTNSANMFDLCSYLTGEKGTRYQDANPKDKTYAHIDGGESDPGYLTDINGPYAALLDNGTTLMFFKDGLRLERTEKTYSLNAGIFGAPGWVADGSNESIEEVEFDESFADARPVTTQSWFSGCSNLEIIIGIENLNTSEVTQMGSMFYGCSSLTNIYLGDFDTHNVRGMTSMFNGCSNLTSLDLTALDTHNVETMSYMFYNCTRLNSIYVNDGWSTEKVSAELSTHMFENCTSLVGDKGTAYDANHVDKAYAHLDGGIDDPGYFSNLPAYAVLSTDGKTLRFYCDSYKTVRPGTKYDLNVGANNPGWYSDNSYRNVTTVVFDPSFANARPTSTCRWFDGMYRMTSLTGLEYLNTSMVTNMNRMFASVSLTSIDLSSFDTRNVTDMSYMFSDCAALESLDLSIFMTNNVTNMNGMFYECSELTEIDLGNFNTSSVTSMDEMFFDCCNLTSLDLSSFDTHNVTSMMAMFVDCNKLANVDLGSFNTANVMDMNSMFGNCFALTSLDLSSFDTHSVTDMGSMFDSCRGLETVYVDDEWSTEGVTTSSGMFGGCVSIVGGRGTTYDSNHTDKAYAHVDGGTSNPGYLTARNLYAVFIADDATLTFYCDDQRDSRPGTIYNLNMGTETNPWSMDGNNGNIECVVIDPSFTNAQLTTTAYMFSGLYAMSSITGFENINMSKVTDASYMFNNCWSALTTLDLTGLDTRNVTNMKNMFMNCESLVTLDLSGFNTAKVTDMSRMFVGCRQLTTIYAGAEWTTDAVTSDAYMFSSCFNLVGSKGTQYQPGLDGKAYAHIDGGPNDPGYLSEKPSFLRGDVNDDNLVNISDAIVLINYLSTGNTTGVNLDNADCTLEGQVNISDAISLINYLLTGVW